MKKSLFFIASINQIFSMDYEPVFSLAKYGVISAYSENRNLKNKAKDLLISDHETFQKGLTQEIGSIEDLNNLDLSKPTQILKVKKAQLFSNYLSEKVRSNTRKGIINYCIQGLVNPLTVHKSPLMAANLFISGVCYTLPLWLKTEQLAHEIIPQVELQKCISPKYNDCLALIPVNQTVAELMKSVYACSSIVSTDPTCQAIYVAAIQKQEENAHMAHTIFMTGITALIFFQTLIQLIRIKFFKPNPNITPEKETVITTYKNSLDLKIKNITSLSIVSTQETSLNQEDV